MAGMRKEVYTFIKECIMRFDLTNDEIFYDVLCELGKYQKSDEFSKEENKLIRRILFFFQTHPGADTIQDSLRESFIFGPEGISVCTTLAVDQFASTLMLKDFMEICRYLNARIELIYQPGLYGDPDRYEMELHRLEEYDEFWRLKVKEFELVC